MEFKKKIVLTTAVAVLITVILGSLIAGYSTLKMQKDVSKTLDQELGQNLPKLMAEGIKEPITEEAGTIAVGSAELGAKLFDDYFEKMRVMGKVAIGAVHEAYSNYDESDPQFRAFLLDRFKSVKELDPNVAYVYFGSVNGGMYMWPDEELPQGYDPRQRPWYQEAVSKNGPVWTEPYKDASTGKWIVTYSEPIYVNGKLVGVIGVDVFVSTLIEQSKEITIGKSGYIAIVNKDGTTIVHPNEELVQKLNIHDDPDLAPLVKELEKNKDSGWVVYTFQGVEKVAGYKRMKTTGWIVLATVPINELTDPLTNAMTDVLDKSTEQVTENVHSTIAASTKTTLLGMIVAVLVGLLMVFGAYRVLDKTLEPLEKLKSVAQALAEGRLSDVNRELRQIQYIEDDEIGALIRAFEAVGKDLVGTLNAIGEKLERLAEGDLSN
ncbi:methyl-accepting chemotaxis protein, partial [Thermococcus sp. 21S7]|uniref:methyl-accepting chemotaxis protein n=1 Tax=Thermococcus sp. 21S7 TaxID=1638221 RepID=UPI00143940E8